jgi:hypothetical protein
VTGEQLRLRMQAIEYAITELEQERPAAGTADALYHDAKTLLETVRQLLDPGTGEVRVVD